MNVVLDFAGVLFHWSPAALLARVLPGREVTPAEFFEGYDGDWGEFDRGRIDPAPLALRIALRTAVTPDEALRVIEAVPFELRAEATMVQLVEDLAARGAPAWFLSNMPRSYAQVLEQRHPFLARFRGGLYSGRVGMAKPEAAIFDFAAQAFGADPARLLFIDDVLANVHAARAAGWNAERFEDAAQCRAVLARYGIEA
jgi:putative hydrolase of the HAD superfamily